MAFHHEVHHRHLGGLLAMVEDLAICTGLLSSARRVMQKRSETCRKGRQVFSFGVSARSSDVLKKIQGVLLSLAG
jgi:hypothetical protein